MRPSHPEPHVGQDPTPTTPLGRHYDVAGLRLALHRAGTGGPAVVFLPGAGMVGLDLLNVQELAAAHVTSVVYDRGGTGWSDAMDLPRTAAAVTDELHQLLHAADVPAPYLLVGHSLGGAYARHFAQRFPSEVAALLLMDPAHEDLNDHMPRQIREAAEHMKTMSWSEPPAGMLDMYRALLPQKLAGWPDAIRDALMTYHLEHWRTGIFEASNADEVVYPELRAAEATPDVPMVVLGSMGIDPSMSLFTPEHIQHEVNDGKRTVNMRLAASVPRGEYRELSDATHAWMHIDRPDAVLQGITGLLGRVKR
ncbi:MAG: alpha/beta fold hydrolase [Gemmatimonadaceae bacterium]